MAYDVDLPGSRLMFIKDGVNLSAIFCSSIASFSKIIKEVENPGTGASVPGLSSTSQTPAAVSPVILVPPSATKQYIVRLHLNNGRHEDVKLGGLATQPTWTNNEAGWQTAVRDIAAAAVV